MITAQYLESLLLNHPMVREVCVLPSATTGNGFDCRAFVVLMQNSPSAIYDFQADCCGLFEGLSVKVDLLPELPKSPMGRVSRERLVALGTESAA